MSLQPTEATPLSEMLSLGLEKHLEDLAVISSHASKEYALEKVSPHQRAHRVQYRKVHVCPICVSVERAKFFDSQQYTSDKGMAMEKYAPASHLSYSCFVAGLGQDEVRLAGHAL